MLLGTGIQDIASHLVPDCSPGVPIQRQNCQLVGTVPSGQSYVRRSHLLELPLCNPGLAPIRERTPLWEVAEHAVGRVSFALFSDGNYGVHAP